MATRQMQMDRMAADSSGTAHIDLPGPAAPGETDAAAAFVCTRRDGSSDNVPPVALGCRVQQLTFSCCWPWPTHKQGTEMVHALGSGTLLLYMHGRKHTVYIGSYKEMQ